MITSKHSERSALHRLQNREDIIIKPADKGSAVVVIDREHCVSEAERQLNDFTFFKTLDHDRTHEFAKKVGDAISEMPTIVHQRPLSTEDKIVIALATETVVMAMYLSRAMRNPAFYIRENKGAVHLRGNPAADQRLCFRYIDCTILLLPKPEISSL